MNIEITSWTCDVCGGTIHNHDDGWVEWLSMRHDDGSRGVRGLRFVHRHPAVAQGDGQGCRYKQRDESGGRGSVVEGLPASDLFTAAKSMRLYVSFATDLDSKKDVLELTIPFRGRVI